MRKLLFTIIAALAINGTISAQYAPDNLKTTSSNPDTIIFDNFEEYTVGNKIAVESQNAGHNWWSTWTNAPGSNEDGVVANFGNTKCGHLTYGNDLVLLLGDEKNGNYDLEFDILVPQSKNGYFNILHQFAGSYSTWAMQCYLHLSNDGQNSTSAPGHGTIHAGSNGTADVACVYDAWMHFRLNVDTDTDTARYYYTAPGEAEVLVCKWQWSLDSFGNNVESRTLSAMDFFPPQDASTSEFYLDNFCFKKIGDDSAPQLNLNVTSVNETLEKDDMTTVNVVIENSGNSIGDWSGWIDFGQGGTGSGTAQLYYHNGDVDLVSGIGSNNAYTREMGIQLPSNAYSSSAMGMRIVSAKFYINDYRSGDGNYIFRIYDQGANDLPGVLLAEKTIHSTAQLQWITATFDDPIYLTGQTIWATVQLEQSAGEYPLTMDGGEYGEHNDGNWLSTNGGAFSHCYSAGAFGGAWLITVNCEGTLVPGTWATINKNYGSIASGQSEVITMTLNSIGLEDGTYQANLVMNTNDTALAHVEIPITLNVGSYSPTAHVLVAQPDTLDLGYRPAGAWMRPYTFTLTNTSAEVQITSMQLQGSGVDALNIDLGDLTLPFTLGENDSVTLGVNWGDQPASVNGTLNVAYSNENGSGSANFAVMAQVYAPAIGDVWELAKEVNSLPFTETLSTSTNHEHLKYCAEEYSGGVGAGGDAVNWGIRFPAADLAAYAGQTLTKVGIFMDVDGDYGWTYSGNYTVNVYQGGADAPGPLVSTATEHLPGDMAWHDITLTDPVAIDTTQDLWLTFYTPDIAYPMSGCDYVGNPNSDFTSLDGVNWDHSTDYGLDYTWMIRGVVEGSALHNNYVLPDPNIPDDNDVVYKLEFEQDVLLNAAITEGDNGKVFLYEQDFQGVGGPDETNGLCFPSNNLLNQTSTFVASASVPYYLVASSTSDDFTVSMNTEPLPCPDTATLLTPSNDATNVSEVNTELRWKFGDYTTQYCLLFGTDPNDMDTLVPWTRELNVQHLFNESLSPCTTYYWQVGTRNDGCPDGVFSEVWSFTTVIRLYTITATSNPAEGGSITGADSYCYGSTCTLVATPNTGYHFVNWTVNDTEVSTSETLTFTVTQDTTLVANFDPIQLQVFADYYPNPADSLGEIVRVHWEEIIVDPHPFSEGFESGDFSKFNWQLDESYPWTITTNDPYEGSYCMKSGGSGVANMESIMTVTVDIPADGQMSFFCKISCESNWDYGYFYIDDAQMGQYTGYRSWEEKKFYITQGLHTFKWRYTKDNSGNYNDDCFYVDNITFYKSSEPMQPGWHTYCESGFNNAVGSNLTATPSWAYEYPSPFLKTNYAGWNITKVSLFSDNMYNAVGGNYTCNIYVGGAEPASGTIVSTITVDVPSGQNDWVDWDLTTPVNVTGNEPIWIVWTANTTVGSWPAGCCGDLNNLGTWWNGGNGWEHLSYGTWTMRQYFDNGAGKGFYSHANESTRDLPNYRVYRALCNESDPTLLTDTVTVQEYLDNDWVSLDHGFYKYGVSIEDGPIYWSDSIKNIAVYYNINASVNPTEGGSVSGMGPQERHTTCSLVATNNTGYHFTNWTLNDSVVSTNNTLEVYVTQDSTFVAHFELNSYDIEASADPTTGGEITGTGTYHHFDDCTLIATPLTGYHFVNWTVNDTEVSTSDTLSFIVIQDSTFVANFAINNHVITALSSNTEGGTVAGGGNYSYGDTCTLVATPATGYAFLYWRKDGSTVSTDDNYSFVVTADGTYYGYFRLQRYTVNAWVNPDSTGTVYGTGIYDYGTTATLTAVPATGYKFLNWTDNDSVVSSSASYSVVVTTTVSLVANFGLMDYDITAEANPTAGGSVSGTGAYHHFDPCTLTATPSTGYHFVNWTLDGSVVGTSPSHSFTVTGDAHYVANFALNSYEITAAANPLDGGAVEGAGTYEHFSACTLTATPATGYHFVNWTLNGSVVGTSETYSFTVTGAAHYVANFALNGYEITAAADPLDGGSVEGTGSYEHFSTCTLTATPSTGYHFLSWTLDGSVVGTSETYSFTVTGPAHYVAHFSLNSYEITASVNPSVGGSVDGAGSYEHFSNCTLTATPSTGYHFVSWTLDGSVVGTSETYSFTVTGTAHYTANFEINTYGITAVADPLDGGNIEGTGTYEHFSTCTLTAVPATGYHFVSWTLDGVVVGTSLSYQFEVSGPVSIVANFETNTYQIIAVTSDPEQGSVTGGGTYSHFDTCTLTATPATGHHFLYWRSDGTNVSTSPTYSFMVTGEAAFAGFFDVNRYTVSAAASPAYAGNVTGGGLYEHGSTCTLTASANPGFAFLNWTLDGAVVSSSESLSFAVTAQCTYTANFTTGTFDISVAASPEQGGTVSGGGTYPNGATATLEASANSHYRFVSWTLDGNVVSGSPSYTFTVTANGHYVANFEELPQYAIAVDEVEGVTITVPASAYAGDLVTVVTECDSLHRLVSLFYYTDDPASVTPISLFTKQFVMPGANVTIGGESLLANKGDANLDGLVNILDVIVTINYICGNDPQPFSFENADMDSDNVIDISDAFAINALIHSLKGLGGLSAEQLEVLLSDLRDGCGDLDALYDVVDGKLYVESTVALAGFQFTLSAEPTVLGLPGFSAVGNWRDGGYVLCLFNLDNGLEPGQHAVLDLNGGTADDVLGATLEGCKVLMEKGTLGVSNTDGYGYAVYPVPARDQVTVKGPNIVSVEVYNAMGQLVKRVSDINADRSVITVSDLSSGSYLLRISTRSGIVVKSVSVAR